MRTGLTPGVVIAYLLLSCSSFARASNVVPGSSLGRIKLGASQHSIHRLLGKPVYVEIIDKLYRSETYLAQRRRPGFYIYVIYKFGKVIQTETNSPIFVTPQGISTRSNVKFIRQRLGKLNLLLFDFPVLYSEPNNGPLAVRYLDGMKNGLAFELCGERLDDPKITKISDSTTPMRIIVHPVGKKVLSISYPEEILMKKK